MSKSRTTKKTTKRRRTKFKPETLELGRRLVAEHKAGKPIDDDDRDTLRARMRVDSLDPGLRAALERLGPTIGYIEDDEGWSRIASTVLAMLLTDKIVVPGAAKSAIVSIIGLWLDDASFEQVAATGRWFGANDAGDRQYQATVAEVAGGRGAA